MATVREIQNLLKRIEITIDENDIADTIEVLHKGEKIEDSKDISEYLIKNAQHINFKKLLVIIVKRRQELFEKYKKGKISSLLEKHSEEELEKAIKFARQYISPDEIIKVESYDKVLEEEQKDKTILDSRNVIYGQKIENKNVVYDKIKDKLPDIEIVVFLEMLKAVLEEEKFAQKQFFHITDEFMIEQGMSEEERRTFWKKLPKAESEEEIIEICKIINKQDFNKKVKQEFEKIKPYINTEKCILFYGCYVATHLEKRKRNRFKRNYFSK